MSDIDETFRRLCRSNIQLVRREVRELAQRFLNLEISREEYESLAKSLINQHGWTIDEYKYNR